MLQNEHWTEEEPINNYKIASLKGIAVSLFSQYHPSYCVADLQESFFTCLLTAGNL